MTLVSRYDKDAFTVLVRRHIDALYNYAFRLSHSTALADDLVQDTWLAVWQKAHAYNPRKSTLTTWLHRVLHNKFVDVIRKQGKERSNADIESAAEDDATIDSGVSSADDMDQRVLAALDQLPTNQRAALMLSYAQGFSNREVALITGTTVRATESLISRARRTLREMLK